jgi:hypothetical protein
MPRLSLYKPNRSNDYNFTDRRVYEMFTIGGTDVHIHKYLGAGVSDDTDATQPKYDTVSEKNIQDLLFLENRDRIYDRDVYTLRGVYNVQDLDFDLSQFGLFLSSDTIFVTFHINNTIERLGRKLIAGDVIELPHLKDFHGLDETLDGALKRYYVVQDVTRAAEGFSATWYPHLYRAKCTPLVDSQEYRDIFNQALDSTNRADDNGGLRDLLSTYKGLLSINDAIVEQAEAETPVSGYNTQPFYVVPTKEDGSLADSYGVRADSDVVYADNAVLTADEDAETPKQDYGGYLVGDGLAPNGFPVTPSVEFPYDAKEGDYVLRVDYMPNRLFRYNGSTWKFVEDNIRTNYTRGTNNSLHQKAGFIQNTATVSLQDGTVVPSKQNLSDILKPKADD